MKSLKTYLKKRKNAIISTLKTPKQQYTAETFHQLRVELKKLDALFALLKNNTKKFKRKKTFKPFKFIFRQAGKIRELYVEEEMLKKHFNRNLPVWYINYLKNLSLQEQKKYFNIVNQSFIKNLQQPFQKVLALLTQLHKSQAKHKLDKCRHKINNVLNKKRWPKTALHQLRKSIKAYNYNIKSIYAGSENKSFLISNKLTDKIGQWHDYQAVTKHLALVIKTIPLDSIEHQQLEKIKVKIALKSEGLLSEIQSKLSKIKV